MHRSPPRGGNLRGRADWIGVDVDNRSRARRPQGKMTNFPRCAIFGCSGRAVRGTTIEVCLAHRADIAQDYAAHRLGTTKCRWPACAEYALSPTLHCARHIAIIAHHGLKWPAARVALDVIEASAEQGWDQPEATVKAPKRPKQGTIYYLRSGGYFKIGWTGNLQQRMKGYPPDTQLLATHPGTRSEERAIHKRYAHLLSAGREWFLLAPEIQDHIERVVSEHGAPPVVDFTARRAKRVVGRTTEYVGGPGRGRLAPRQVRG